MNFMLVFGAFCMAAYALQIVFGMQQLKHFNTTYREMRHLGRVAIGRRAGKVKSGDYCNVCGG